jgi:hypothetical protein
MATGERDDHFGTQEGLDEAQDTPKSGWRHRLRTNPATKVPYKVGVFVVGLLFIALGLALAVLPGPLTIPPVLLGLYVWSTEFRFAEKLFDGFKEKARDAWEHAKRKPVSSAIITVAGLAAAGVAFWAVGHYELIDKGKDFVGLG